MQNPTPLEVRAREQRLASRRRARRGLVAGYIHELSARHAAAPRGERTVQPAAAVLGGPLAEREVRAGV